MKIENAWVTDPAVRGIFERPFLTVEVDELPDVTIPDEAFDGGWVVGKYGPFIKYSKFNSTASLEEDVDAGDFNVRFANKFQPIVDVGLVLKGDPDQETRYDYALNLARGRQLIRKWDSSWRLLLADKEAQNGRMVWHPVLNNPTCRFFYGNGRLCGQEVVGTVRMGSTELPYCRQHIKEYNDRHAAKRASSSR